VSSATLDNVLEEARRLLSLAHAADVPLHLLGGAAVRLRAPEVPPSLDRVCKDIDFVVRRNAGKDAARLLREAAYEPDVAFNAMNGRERLLFHDPARARQVDVFVDSFQMCHQIPLAGRLDGPGGTVPLAELLLTKLQIVELNEKDARDTVLLLHGHPLTDDDEGINQVRIAELCAQDWGLWRTITRNLERCRDMLAEYDLPAEDAQRIAASLDALLERIEAQPKARGWRIRAKVGERRRWYALPEEVA
jgi:hypothetical protein